MAQLFDINKTYTFNTLAPSKLGVTIRNAKLIEVESYSSAKLSFDVDSMYREIYPLLPTGVLDAPQNSIYYTFKGENNEKIKLADIWIDAPSIVLVDAIDIRIDIPGVDLTDVALLQNYLTALGYGTAVVSQV